MCWESCSGGIPPELTAYFFRLAFFTFFTFFAFFAFFAFLAMVPLRLRGQPPWRGQPRPYDIRIT